MRWNARRLGAAAIGVVAVAVVGLTIGAGMRRLDFFRVRKVEVYGTKYLSGPEVVAAMDLPASASVFDRTDSWRDRVAVMPGVVEAEVGRRLPGTLRVRLREAEPVGLAPHEGRLVLLDARGAVLPFDPTRVAPDLPVLPVDDAVAGVVGRLKAVDPALYAELVSAARRRGDVVLEAGPHRLLLRIDASVEEMQNMAAVAQDLAARGQRWRELDGRFRGIVVVRGLGG